MNKFLMREIKYNYGEEELNSIGFDSSYINSFTTKFEHKNIKIYDLSLPQANILKQIALMFGADCAINKNVITGNIKKSDVILTGSISQLKKISLRLREQPFKLAILANQIIEFIENRKRQTKLVGILNITPDSFSDGGKYFDISSAQEKLLQLIQEGADIIDIGAESTRPYSAPVTSQEQILRLKPILEFIQKENIKIKTSVDTRSSLVAEFALDSGVQIINDVSGFTYDSKMPEIIAKYNAEVVIQHSTGQAENIIDYKNVVEDVFFALIDRINLASQNGIKNIIVDPGIGFGKTVSDNIKIINDIKAFYSLNCPIMVGISRKSFLGENDSENSVKDALTLAYSYPLIQTGVDYLRVHNVKLHKTLLKSIPN